MSKGILSSPPDRKKNALLAIAEYSALWTTVAVLRLLPLRGAYLFSELILFGLFLFIPRLRSRSLEQIHIAYGQELPEAERHKLLSKSIRFNAWFWTDMLIGPYLLRKEKYQKQVDSSELIEVLQSLRVTDSSGLLMVSSHQGAPDIISLALGKLGYSTGVVARPLDNKYISRFIQRGRQSFKRTEFAKSGALRPAYKHLRSKGILGMQIDQDAGETGVFVPFFGTPASTHKGPATLALMTQTPTYMVFCIRSEARAFKFKLYVEKIAIPEGDPSDEDTLASLTASMTRVVENFTRRFPEQYMWAHRRWKTRPTTKPTVNKADSKPHLPALSANR